jgi:transposase-like protein
MPKPTSIIPETQVKPDPKSETRSRRIFTTEYKLSVLRRADACKHGELGELLRKEKLYSNQLSQWRREFAEGGIDALSKSAPGPAPGLTAEQKKIQVLEKKIVKLEKQLEIKDQCIDLQKKVLGMIEQLEQGSAP